MYTHFIHWALVGKTIQDNLILFLHNKTGNKIWFFTLVMYSSYLGFVFLFSNLTINTSESFGSTHTKYHFWFLRSKLCFKIMVKVTPFSRHGGWEWGSQKFILPQQSLRKSQMSWISTYFPTFTFFFRRGVLPLII